MSERLRNRVDAALAALPKSAKLPSEWAPNTAYSDGSFGANHPEYGECSLRGNLETREITLDWRQYDSSDEIVIYLASPSGDSAAELAARLGVCLRRRIPIYSVVPGQDCDCGWAAYDGVLVTPEERNDWGVQAPLVAQWMQKMGVPRRFRPTVLACQVCGGTGHATGDTLLDTIAPGPCHSGPYVQTQHVRETDK